MFRRARALRDPVTLELDGEAVPAERGEPIAAALLAADKTIVARSPKLHRPRAPSCFRGACDGCLARVDGVPNVMTCLAPARGGEVVEAQNVVGSRRADLLRVTDWFFKKGIDHHHLMAGVPGLSDVMQSFARKLAGLGRLPAKEEAGHPARRVDVDALVVGGGPSGVAVASRLARSGAETLLVDDAIAVGGSLVALPSRLDDLLRAHPLDGVDVATSTVVAGIYEGEAMMAGPSGATLAKARAIVFATGAHDGMLAFSGNDLPGVFSARALLRVLSFGLELDGPLVVAGEGFWADELTRAVKGAIRVPASSLVGVEGVGGARAAIVERGGAQEKIACAALAIATSPAPAFELLAQAGAETMHTSAGYVVKAGDRGRLDRDAAGPKLWAVGECRGLLFEPDALIEDAERVAEDVALSLR